MTESYDESVEDFEPDVIPDEKKPIDFPDYYEPDDDWEEE